jgi:hypothetical protein
MTCLRDHWAEPAVLSLALSLRQLNPIGLSVCPRDEYEPEALLTLALLCGKEDADSFLALSKLPVVDPSSDEMLSAVNRSFSQNGISTEWTSDELKRLEWGVRSALCMLLFSENSLVSKHQNEEAVNHDTTD